MDAHFIAVGVGLAETSMANLTARLAISSNEAIEPEPVLKVSPSKVITPPPINSLDWLSVILLSMISAGVLELTPEA